MKKLRWIPTLLFAGGLAMIGGGLLLLGAPIQAAEDCPPSLAPLDDVALTGVRVASVPASLSGDDACLNCHTDRALLETLAVPKESEHEALSSGPG